MRKCAVVNRRFVTGLVLGSLAVSGGCGGGSGSPSPMPVASVSPTNSGFGNQDVGTTSAARAVTLANTGAAALSITGISASGDFAQTSNCPASLAAGSNCTIQVTFTPTTTGPRVGALTVADNAAGSPQTVSLTGTGSSSVTSASLYVATNGNDSWSGTLAAPNAGGSDGPFLTLARAQQAARNARGLPAAAITVEIRSGSYYLPAPLEFTSADSGSAAQPIIWRRYAGDVQPVEVSGGRPLKGWTNVSGNRWTTQVPGTFSNFEALYYNGQRRFRPRTTATYLLLNPVILPSPDTNCSEAFQNGYRCRDRFKFNPGDLSADYHDMTDVEIVSFENWTVSRMRLLSVDTVHGIAYLTGPAATGPNFGYLSGHRYLVENVQESLSQPGQWYLDRATTPWTITYLANPGEDPNADTVVVPQQPQLLVADGLQYVTFQNLTFAHDDFAVPSDGHVSRPGETSSPAALSFTNCSHVTLNGAVVAHTQGWGIEFIGTAAAGVGNAVTRSVIYDLGAGGIRVGQVAAPGDTDQNVSQYNTISENAIFGGGRYVPGGEGTAVWIGSSHHNVVSHNDVHDFYNGALELGQSPNGALTYTHDNLLAFNLLYDLGQGTTSDMGCVHIGSANNTGNQVLNNVCHDVTHDPGAHGYGGFGIYVDANSQNLDIENNLVYRVSASTLFLNLASANNTVKNNIFAFGRQGLIQRGLQAGSFTASQNIFLYDIGSIQHSGDWSCPSGCGSEFLLDRNVYWNVSGTPAMFYIADPANPLLVLAQYTLAQWQTAQGEDLNSQNVDPLFTNPKYPQDDFALLPNSPAFAAGIGFVAFSPGDAGPTGALPLPIVPVPPAYPLQLLNPAADF
jgi:HYDIN/CFA65/VesB-like, Ig-like domain/Right handed beta helix region